MKSFEEKYAGMKVAELGARYLALREAHQQLKDQAAVVWHEVDYLRFTAIPDGLEAENNESVKVEGVGRIGTRIESACKTIDKDALRDWLVANEAEDLISEAINASSLKAFISQRIRDGQPIPGSEIVEFKPFVVGTVTKG